MSILKIKLILKYKILYYKYNNNMIKKYIITITFLNNIQIDIENCIFILILHFFTIILAITSFYKY